MRIVVVLALASGCSTPPLPEVPPSPEVEIAAAPAPPPPPAAAPTSTVEFSDLPLKRDVPGDDLPDYCAHIPEIEARLRTKLPDLARRIAVSSLADLRACCSPGQTRGEVGACLDKKRAQQAASYDAGSEPIILYPNVICPSGARLDTD